jgi:ribosome-binding protein aMBF1 (putative translation factor)
MRIAQAVVILAFAHDQERQGHGCDTSETDERRAEDRCEDSAGEHEQQHPGKNRKKCETANHPVPRVDRACANARALRPWRRAMLARRLLTHTNAVPGGIGAKQNVLAD